MNTKKHEEMIKKEVWTGALAHLIKQGPLVILLFFGLNHFMDKYHGCNEQVIELYQKQNENLIKVVEKNSKAIEDFSFYLKSQK